MEFIRGSAEVEGKERTPQGVTALSSPFFFHQQTCTPAADTGLVSPRRLQKGWGRGASGTLTTHSPRELCAASGCKASWVPSQPRLLFILQKPCHILPCSACSLVDKPSASARHKEFTFNLKGK